MKFVINLFLALAVGMPVYSWANPLSSQALPDLLDLYRYAQKHDPHLSVAIARKQADQEQFAQARSHLLPNLSLTADSGRVVRRLQDRAETIPVIENKFDQKMLQARLSLPLVDLQRWYGYRAGKAASARAEAEFGAALQLFHQRLVEAYVQVLNAQSKLNIRKAERAAAMRQQEKLRRQLDAGMVSRVDVEVINAEVSRLKVQFIRAQGDAEQALRVLEVLTGQTLVGVKPLKNQFEQSVADRPLGYWMDRALARNLDLVTARLTRETLDLQASAAKAAHLPTLSLNAQAQHELSGTAAGLGPNSQEFVTETGSVTLRLEVPLYSGGGTSSLRREATYRLAEARANYRLVYEEVTSEVAAAFHRLETQRDAIKAAKDSVRAQQSAVAAAEEGHRAGIRDAVDLIRAQRELFAAVDVLEETRFDLLVTLSNLYQLSGDFDEGLILQVNEWVE